MRFVGIDIGAEQHVVAIVDAEGAVQLKASRFGEDAAGYAALDGWLGEPADTLVAMEATGHYWQNLFVHLTARGFQVALLNPLRTRRFAEEDLLRTKTDAIDAVGIARFAQQKHPAPTVLADEATLELREQVRMRERLVQDLGDRTRELHRLVDLGFPEFAEFFDRLDSSIATTILASYPTAASFANAGRGRLASLKYDGRHKVGDELAKQLIAAAKVSVGRHHGAVYRTQVEYCCEDISTLRRRIRKIDHGIDDTLQKHEVGKLLTSIEGIGKTTAARLVAELGDIAAFGSPGAIASYIGVVPALRHSGKSTPARASISSIGHKRLRRALWMPTLVAVQKNPWLRAFYKRLRAAGKPPKVALVAAMRKLMTAVFFVAKNRRPFVPLLPAVTGSATANA
jgi:transposase